MVNAAFLCGTANELVFFLVVFCSDHYSINRFRDKGCGRKAETPNTENIYRRPNRGPSRLFGVWS